MDFRFDQHKISPRLKLLGILTSNGAFEQGFHIILGPRIVSGGLGGLLHRCVVPFV